jgi:bacteriophage N4 adsorption protein B
VAGQQDWLIALDAAAREATLFAALWFVIGGLDDLLVDLIYAVRRIGGWRLAAPVLDSALPPGRIAVFVPAWDESRVIGTMLRAALTRFDHPDYRIYVGTYPNDRDTVRAVADVAREDERVRLVVGGSPGPTTKADCLNRLWRALLRDERADGVAVSAIALHDAEDVVHPLELQVFAHCLLTHAAVQLPVLPIRHPRSRFVSGHYLDDFTESHGKAMVVRQAVGAGMPFAGVGCAIRRDVLARLAKLRGGSPFDADSLTEDYELGLAIAAMGGRTWLARVREPADGQLIAVRAYFPHRFEAAVRQKTRWTIGIALAGWDRTGWSRTLHIGDHWMRMRDRRATLAMPVLAIAYLAMLLGGLAYAVHALLGLPPPESEPVIVLLLAINFLLLSWRMLMRATFVGAAYGWGEAWWSIPRTVVGNLIGLFAAQRAMFQYVGMLAGAPPRWDKTAHHFPDLAEPGAA